MKTIQFQVKGEYVRLCDLLKLAGIAGSGAQSKHMVAEGEVNQRNRTLQADYGIPPRGN